MSGFSINPEHGPDFLNTLLQAGGRYERQVSTRTFQCLAIDVGCINGLNVVPAQVGQSNQMISCAAARIIKGNASGQVEKGFAALENFTGETDGECGNAGDTIEYSTAGEMRIVVIFDFVSVRHVRL